jgi:2-polyprenyl-3-methyl-5-hydroxy-6-metoxy-1,4-benzoquinol methylase
MFYSEKRDERVKDTAEVFTPPELVNKMLDELDYDWEALPDKTFLDPTCGSGNFLVEVAKRGVHPKNIYGVDLMEDNVQMTKKRLQEIYEEFGYTDYEEYLEKNIVQGDALTYDYNFGESAWGEW